jgi:hypothetical protein
MVRGIISDENIQGQVFSLVAYLDSPAWRDIWRAMNLPVFAFQDVGLAPQAPDNLVWEVCQREQLVLLTANRNADGPDSLEVTLRTRNTPDSLPVFTVGDAQRLLHSREYGEQVAERLLDYLLEIDRYRGVGRLYLP